LPPFLNSLDISLSLFAEGVCPGFFNIIKGFELEEKVLAHVGVIMGSKSDWETMKFACEILDELEISYEKKVVSAHRTPDLMFEYAENARGKGIKVIIAGAGGAAHLPGMVAAKTTLPVIGVPVQSRALNGLDSLLSIVQMPGGVPVATVAIGKAGAVNAGLLAAQILGSYDSEIADRLDNRREKTKQEVIESSDELV
jgi:5-(carboxyamino)imidazole ribonucleotide mutase